MKAVADGSTTGVLDFDESQALVNSSSANIVDSLLNSISCDLLMTYLTSLMYKSLNLNDRASLTFNSRSSFNESTLL